MSDKMWRILKISSIALICIDIVYILFSIFFMILYRFNVLNIVTDMQVFVIVTIVLLSINALYVIWSTVLLIVKKLRRV